MDMDEEYQEFLESTKPRSFWSKVERSRADNELQAKHPLEDAKERYFEECSPCSECGRPPEGLTWLYFLDSGPGNSREGGWMTVCDEDRLMVNFFVDQREFFDWEAVEKARQDAELQAHYAKFGGGCGSQHCPKCGRGPEELTCIWVGSSDDSWRSLAGVAGWLLICDACHIQVDFVLIMMS